VRASNKTRCALGLSSEDVRRSALTFWRAVASWPARAVTVPVESEQGGNEQGGNDRAANEPRRKTARGRGTIRGGCSALTLCPGTTTAKNLLFDFVLSRRRHAVEHVVFSEKSSRELYGGDGLISAFGQFTSFTYERPVCTASRSGAVLWNQNELSPLPLGGAGRALVYPMRRLTSEAGSSRVFRVRSQSPPAPGNARFGPRCSYAQR